MLGLGSPSVPKGKPLYCLVLTNPTRDREPPRTQPTCTMKRRRTRKGHKGFQKCGSLRCAHKSGTWGCAKCCKVCHPTCCECTTPTAAQCAASACSCKKAQCPTCRECSMCLRKCAATPGGTLGGRASPWAARCFRPQRLRGQQAPPLQLVRSPPGRRHSTCSTALTRRSRDVWPCAGSVWPCGRPRDGGGGHA